jgi:hypothetical protein
MRCAVILCWHFEIIKPNAKMSIACQLPPTAAATHFHHDGMAGIKTTAHQGQLPPTCTSAKRCLPCESVSLSTNHHVALRGIAARTVSEGNLSMQGGNESNNNNNELTKSTKQPIEPNSNQGMNLVDESSVPLLLPLYDSRIMLLHW